MSHDTRSANRALRGHGGRSQLGNEDLVGRQNTIRANISAFHPLISYKNEFMLWLILGVFTWLGSFIRTRHDLALEIVALKQQLIVLKRRTKRRRLRWSDWLFWVIMRRVLSGCDRHREYSRGEYDSRKHEWHLSRAACER
jgi:hypothetical protein